MALFKPLSLQFVIAHRNDDGSYWAEVEGLPGCFTSGANLDELKEAVIEAISLYLDEGGEPKADEPDLRNPGTYFYG